MTQAGGCCISNSISEGVPVIFFFGTEKREAVLHLHRVLQLNFRVIQFPEVVAKILAASVIVAPSHLECKARND